MNDTLFRILAVVIFLTTSSISIYYRRKADRVSGEKISLKEEGFPLTVTLRLLGLMFWLSVFAYMINPAWMAWSRVPLPEWARWTGVGMGMLGALMAYWVFSHLGNNVTPTVVTREQATLVTSGPYRWVRHPLYVMGMIAYIGFALIAENIFIAAAAVVGFIFLAIRLQKEEANLISRFGDSYREYMRRTGKFFPKLLR